MGIGGDVEMTLTLVENKDGQAGTTREPREHRKRVLKGGSILQGISKSEIACTLRNQTEGGAELSLDREVQVPDRFLLYVAADNVGYQCSVRWRDTFKGRVGVQFEGTEPKPRWHYGQ